MQQQPEQVVAPAQEWLPVSAWVPRPVVQALALQPRPRDDAAAMASLLEPVELPVPPSQALAKPEQSLEAAHL